LTGDVTAGAVSFDGSGNVALATTIAANSVALGTDTTGNYMSDLTEGTGIDITHTPAEGSNGTIALDLTEVGFGGGANRLITDDGDGTVSTESNLTFDGNHLDIANGHLVLPYGEINDAGTDLNIVGTNAVTLQSSAGTALTIPNASTNVGIGTQSPNRLLHLQSTGDTIMQITSADGSGAFIDLGDVSDVDGGRIVYDSGSNLIFNTASTEKLRIDSSGNVGIGATTVDDGNLQIGDANSTFNIAIAGPRTKFGYNGSNAIVQGGTSKGIAFCVNNPTLGSGEVMRINSSGNVGIGTESPGSKLDIENTTAPTLSNDTHAGEAIFLRSGGSAGDGNVQGVLAFGKADGSSRRSGSAIASVQTDSDVDKVGIGFYTSDSSASSQTMDQRMLLDHIGNVGIGTSSPAHKLDVNGGIRNYANGSAVLRTESTAGGYGAYNRLITTTNTYDMYSLNGDFLIRETDVATRFIIKDTTGHIELPNDNQYLKFGEGGDGVIYSLNDDFYISNFTAGQDTIFQNLNSAGSSYVTNLFIDGSAERVGIGVTSPGDKLHIAGNVRIDGGDVLRWNGQAFIDTIGANDIFIRPNGSTATTITAGGKVGIGTASPNYTLQVDSNRADATFDANNVSTWADVKIQGDTASGNARGIYFDFDDDTGDDKGAGIVGISGDATGGVGSLGFITTAGNVGAERMRIASSGNVGIGTTSPSVELHVKDASSHAQLRIETDSASHGAYLELEGSANKYQIYNVGGDLGIDESGVATRLTIKDTTGDVLPGADGTQDLGASDKRWGVIYSADLDLSNEGSENDVDGTWGSYVIQEGEDDLFLINRRSGKKYKFMLQEVQD
jgi:hypothetical protein